MKVESVVVGPYVMNCHIAACEKTNEAVIIDPGAEPEAIAARVDAMGVKPVAITNTHGHPDHIGAVEAIKEMYDIPFHINSNEQVILDAASQIAGSFGVPFQHNLVVEGHLEDEGVFEFGEVVMRVIHTPGHTPGGVSLLAEDHLFVGDTLFYGGIGRTDLLGGSYEELIHSIKERLFTLDEETTVYSGHGPTTTIGKEKKYNPFVGERAVF